MDLNINPNTVARSYNELEIRGIVTTQQGTGTFISDQKVELTQVEREKVLSDIARSFISKAQSYGFSIEDIIAYLKGEDVEEDFAIKLEKRYEMTEHKRQMPVTITDTWWK